MVESTTMSDEDFNKEIKELKRLSKVYKTVHPSSRECYYRQYLTQLYKISGETHMEIEDIVLYLY